MTRGVSIPAARDSRQWSPPHLGQAFSRQPVKALEVGDLAERIGLSCIDFRDQHKESSSSRSRCSR
jgi:hypothetical protein